MTLESIFVPRSRDRLGLSPLRDQSAAPSQRTRDIFAGVVSRVLFGAQDVLTTRVGLLGHGMVLTPPGEGDTRLTPSGWRDNSFSNVDHWGVRQSLTVSWDHGGMVGFGAHTVSSSFELQRRGMRASVHSSPIRIEDADGRIARLVEFGGPVRMQAAETSGAIVIRDDWSVNSRLQDRCRCAD